MIHTKADLHLYLEEDRKALGLERKHPYLVGDEIWKFEIVLRKLEYYSNNKGNMFATILRKYYKLRFRRMSVRLGFSIPLNVFDYGLSIAHYGTICVNNKSCIGKYCRIHEGVTIGASGGGAPIVGDNVFIGSGAKIIGEVSVANNIAIGANAVVTKSFKEEGITLAGVPAHKISQNSSKNLLKYYQ